METLLFSIACFGFGYFWAKRHNKVAAEELVNLRGQNWAFRAWLFERLSFRTLEEQCYCPAQQFIGSEAFDRGAQDALERY